MENILPKNWVETNLKNVVNSTKGKKPARLEEFKFEESLPYMDIKALEFNNINQYADIKSSKSFSKGDVAIVWDGARSGWVSKATSGAIGSTICALTPIKINTDYLYYFLLDKYPFINSKARGVGIPHVDPILLWSLGFPLPPLAEQKRIADKLDVLFGQIEAMRKAADRIPELIKNFRQQVLTYAVTGKLTEHKGEKRLLGDLLVDVRYGTSKKSDYEVTGYPVLRIPNISNGEINSSDLKYAQLEIKEYTLLSLKEGDILIIRSNGSISLVGQCSIVRKEHENYAYAGYLIRIRCNDDLEPDYINYSLRSESVRVQIIENAHSTSGVNNINAEQIKQLEIVWYPIIIQQEIVRRVQSLFDKIEMIEQSYNRLKTKLDNLPQALLHKAFKGELVEQLPTDGNAIDLLREIQELKKSVNKKR
ncbi:MAG: hypothetical protein H6Q14_402 [Bacteroidetes bacterium]|nr:hypothetical protein [Bacteroidota bacterium]MBP1616575.1 hypothetical protein [Bacteroidota bacterium]